MHTRETLWELLQLRNTNFLIWSNGLDNITYFKLWCILWNTDFPCSVLSLEAKAGRPSKVCFGNNLWMQLFSDLIKTDEMEQIGGKWWRNLSETGRAMSQRAVWMNAVWWNSLCILSQQRSASSVHLCNQQDYWNRIERLWWYIFVPIFMTLVFITIILLVLIITMIKSKRVIMIDFRQKYEEEGRWCHHVWSQLWSWPTSWRYWCQWKDILMMFLLSQSLPMMDGRWVTLLDQQDENIAKTLSCKYSITRSNLPVKYSQFNQICCFFFTLADFRVQLLD